MSGKLANLKAKESFLSGAVKSLQKNIKGNIDANNLHFVQEFERIERIPPKSAVHSMKDINRRLNRYNNILAWDDTRVTVTKTKMNNETDYINANFVDGFGGDPIYIAAQAPVPDGFNAFWQMIWEQDCRYVIMVTNEVEGGKLKAHRYWPDKNMPKLEINQYIVSFSFQEVYPSFVRRVFQLTDQRNNQSRDITQYAFTAWPDHGVPSTTQELLDFRQEVRKEWNPKKGKLIVHCSAGVGRTGTFIALDRYLEALSNGKEEPIYELVCGMRGCRNFLVQSQIQYIYLHHTCLDGAHDMLMEVQRDLRHSEMNDDQVNEDEMNHLEEMVNEAEQMLDDEIEAGEDELEQEFKDNPSEFDAPLGPRTGSMRQTDPAKIAAMIAAAGPPEPKGPRVKIDAHHHTGQYKDDLHKASVVTANQRKTSLLDFGGKNSDFWCKRRNVPLSVKEKGYLTVRARNLTSRLKALDEQKLAWVKRYEDASDKWDRIRLDGGDVYELSKELTPLESRLESLVAAEEAWLYRGDGFRSAREEDVRRTLSRLNKRLQSLHETLLNSEARWRARGDGMRQPQIVETHVRVNTSSRVGGLMERLELLQQEEQAWIRRDNWARFDRSSFETDVKTERSKQERAQTARDQAESHRIAEAEQAQARAKAASEAIASKAAAEQKEIARREDIKEKMRAASLMDDSYNPAKERMAKQKTKEEIAKAEADAKAAEDAQRAVKEAQEQAKKKELEDAKSKASKFLGKLKQ